ncbi:MAG: sigma-70 family RNA polymerase sigma factor [Verrucomicrobiales bacterium]|nr:sigma-70 family RNA polymerase sigma factor [Verrucomicrobiales bacterium]
MEDWELIESYAKQHSESAFRKLVERHAGLVFGSALRQVRDAHLAQDVTQAVFILLARKAPNLRKGTILSGWLFQTTSFVASRAVRAEQRRQRREQEAFAMQQLSSTDKAWQRIEPVIDDALDRIGRADRDAVLLRYLEGKTLREVGAALGVTEEAAKKRVNRAMERLRTVLTRSAVSLSTGLIASALSSNANASVPGTVLAGITGAARAITATDSAAALASEALAAWRWARLKLAAAITATALLVTSFITITIGRPNKQSTAELSPAPPPAAASSIQNVAASGIQEPLAGNSELNILRLHAVDAATGEGLPNARVASTVWAGESVEDHWDLVTDASGRCRVPYAPGTRRLDVGVVVDGWAARFATWPSEGVTGIPGEYTLRLERTTATIGGQILDLDGQPVANADIWFQGGEAGDSAHRERPRERFGFLHAVPAGRTDAQGRWTIGFIPPRHPGFFLVARHRDFAETSVISSDAQESVAAIEREDLKQLWAGELVTMMKAAFTLSGTVVGEDNLPIPGAKIQQREQGEVFTTDDSGAFQVPGLREGVWDFTVSANGFAPVRTNAQISAEMRPMLVMLQPGGILRVRVIDEQGAAVPDATVGLAQWGEHRNALSWQAKTDGDGRLEWHSAPPDAELELYARKDGFCYTRDVKVNADGDERVIKLQHALDVFGQVADAETGEVIRDFKAMPGYGQKYHDAELRWFAAETVRGTNGLFKLTFAENAKPWQVRILAEGYEDWVSDPLESADRTVTLNIALKRAVPEESVRGAALKPDGTPASGAQVALLSLDHNVRLLRTLTFQGNRRWLTTCDEKGEFRFPANQSAHSLAAASPDGYAQVRIRGAQEPVTLQLQPWGRVEGVVDVSARTYPVESIELYDPAADNYQGRISLLGAFSAKVDANGHFSFENVPPGEFSAFINSLAGIPFHHQTPLTVLPGETTQITIAERTGTLLKGRFLAPPGRSMDWNKDLILARVELESLRSPPGWNPLDEGKLASVEFWTSSAGREFVNARRMVSLRVGGDGSFLSVERVPAGEYRFSAVFKNASLNRKLIITSEDEQLPDFDLRDIELR